MKTEMKEQIQKRDAFIRKLGYDYAPMFLSMTPELQKGISNLLLIAYNQGSIDAHKFTIGLMENPENK